VLADLFGLEEGGKVEASITMEVRVVTRLLYDLHVDVHAHVPLFGLPRCRRRVSMRTCWFCLH